MGNCIILYTQTVSDVDSDVVVQYRTEVGGIVEIITFNWWGERSSQCVEISPKCYLRSKSYTEKEYKIYELLLKFQVLRLKSGQELIQSISYPNLLVLYLQFCILIHVCK